MFRRHFVTLSLVSLASLRAQEGQASSPTPVRFGLDWSATGAHAPYFAAAARGLFQRRGLQVTIEPGAGAADAVERVATGKTEFGIADLSAIIRHNARHPDHAVTAFYIVHDRSPLSVVTLSRNNIAHPRHLEGRTIGAPEGEAGRTMFPVFARAAGFDAAKVSWRTTEARLRESELVAGTVDAITGFSTTAPFLVLQGVPSSEIRVLQYADYGLDHYSTAVFTTASRIAQQRPLVVAFAQAIDEGMRWSMSSPEEAVEVLSRSNPRIVKDVESRRLKTTIRQLMVTPATQANGLASVDPPRLQRMIEDVCSSLGAAAPRPPSRQVFEPAIAPSRLPAMPWLESRR